MSLPGPLGVVGFESAQQRLASYLRSGRIHPAMVLVGPDGESRWSLAKNIAKSLLCPSKLPTQAFCGRCAVCRRVDSDAYPDLTLARANPDEPTVKIEWIRGLCNDFHLSALEGRIKVCIIENFERVNSSASNALLKTLEEPPADRYFLLLTSKPSALLPTIASRCLFFSMGQGDAGAVAAPRLSFESIEAAVAHFDSREDCVEYVTQIQSELRDRILGLVAEQATPDEVLPHLDAFEDACTLQSRLRSQANYGLLLETFLRERNSQLTLG